jgi:hypothetical protein
MAKNESFSSKHLAVSKIVSTFALAFEKSLLLANIKKESNVKITCVYQAF